MASPAPPTKDPADVFGRLDDQAWFDVLLRSQSNRLLNGVQLPGFPPDAFQIGTIGSTGAQALGEAFHFWKLLRSLATRFDSRLNRGSRVLDFGCGWGRMARFWLRDLNSQDIWGVDVAQDMLTYCRDTFGYCRFEAVPAEPPSSLPRTHFDLVYAYSVFSHLNEVYARAWIRELTDVLRPGGLLVVTTEGLHFLNIAERMRNGGTPQNPWEASLARVFVDTKNVRAAYERGEFLHEPTGGGEDRPSTFYGESVIPRQYVERNWTERLTLLEFIDDPSVLGQALIVMQKPD